jgi:hypothetical protein
MPIIYYHIHNTDYVIDGERNCIISCGKEQHEIGFETDDSYRNAWSSHMRCFKSFASTAISYLMRTKSLLSSLNNQR